MHNPAEPAPSVALQHSPNTNSTNTTNHQSMKTVSLLLALAGTLLFSSCTCMKGGSCCGTGGTAMSCCKDGPCAKCMAHDKTKAGASSKPTEHSAAAHKKAM